MVGIKLNMGEAGKGREQLPEKVYPAIVSDTDLTRNKANTGTNLVITFEITDPEYAGRTLKLWIPVDNPKVLWKLKEVLEAITDTPWDQDEMELDHRELRGYTVQLVVVQGEQYNSIQKVIPSGEDAPVRRRSL
jgi:hypothetical protein